PASARRFRRSAIGSRKWPVVSRDWSSVMAMNVGGGGSIKSDINVTPLVDVMLVLLIIIMIVAPLQQQGVAFRLPVATNTKEKPDTQDQTVLAIDSQKRLYLN